MSRQPAVPLSREDAPWLGAALAAGALAVVVYLLTNAYPAYGAGLYVQTAAAIAENGYAPPTTVPGYTAEGVPFAYPPLQFYVLALLLDAGADPIATARFLPSLAVLAALVPVYLLGRDYTESRPAGAAAGVAVALNPQILQWHISAGGLVRAFAFCYALTAIYAGYHVFRDGSRRAVLAGAAAFGLTLLSHPTYSLFVVVSYLLLWGVRDRTWPGLVRGAAVGVGGTVVAGPWLAWVVATHGLAVLTGAAGTHGGIGGGAATIGFSATLLPILGAAYLLVARRDYFLAAWIAVAELLFAQPRFVFTVGSIVAAAVAVEVSRRVRALEGSFSSGSLEGVDRRAAAAAFCLLLASIAGGAYLTHEATLQSDPSTPEFLDSDDVEAMAWVAAETPPDTTFVVAGDAAEWFPALTDRTILVGPWGVEWYGPERYDRQLATFRAISVCDSADCVEEQMSTVGASPDYVYLPKGAYTVRGKPEVTFGTLERSFEHDGDWVRVFENDGVVVFRAVD